MMKKILFSVLAVALLWSCGKDDGPDTPPASTKPTITDFTPKTGPEGTEVTITGTNFSTTKTQNTIKFGDITATVDNATATQLMTKVPTGATTGKISVTVDGEAATSTADFVVTAIEPENSEPEIEDQEFAAAEDIADTDEIDQVMATDADGDDLTFAMVANDNDLFMLSESGILTLAEGKTLDYETATSHSITVSVSDGKETVEATVTITVENVIESMAEDPDSFITTWEVSDIDNNYLLLPTNDLYSYDFTVDWGDGTVEDYTDNDIPEHFYENAGVYTVAIKGEFPSIKVVGQANQNKLLSVDRWGNIAWQTFRNAFTYCTKLEINADDNPDLSNVTDMSFIFQGSNFNGDISDWEVGNVTNMSYMFLEAPNFDQDLGGWNIENVEKMTQMLENSGMSASNFSNTLIGWAAQDVQPNIVLGATGLYICLDDENGNNAVVTLSNAPNNWTILSDGVKPCN